MGVVKDHIAQLSQIIIFHEHPEGLRTVAEDLVLGGEKLPENLHGPDPGIAAIGPPGVIEHHIFTDGRVLFRIPRRIGVVKHIDDSSRNEGQKAQPDKARPSADPVFFSLSPDGQRRQHRRCDPQGQDDLLKMLVLDEHGKQAVDAQDLVRVFHIGPFHDPGRREEPCRCHKVSPYPAPGPEQVQGQEAQKRSQGQIGVVAGSHDDGHAGHHHGGKIPDSLPPVLIQGE